MLEYLADLATRLGHWAYLVIFAGAAAESAAFLGLFVPGESLVILAGFLAAQGVFDLDVLIAVVAAGAMVGDNIGYELGRHFGAHWALKHGRRFGMTPERLKAAEAFFSRHGGKSVFLGRFVGFARALVPFIAGSVRMRYLVFLVYNALGASSWAAAFTLLGYFAGQAAEQIAGRASAIVGGVVFFALVLLWLWHWMAAHEREVRGRWERIKHGPRIAAMLERFAPQLDWLRRRLSPQGYFGLQLTSAVLLFIGAAWLFGGVTEDVLTGDPLTVFDKQVEQWFYRHQNAGVTAFMVMVSWLHTWPIALASALFLAYVAWRRHWRWVVIALLTIPGGVLLNVVVKLAVHRERPDLSGLAAALRTYSFPSGHTITATLIYGLFAAYLISGAQMWRQRVTIGVAAAFLVMLVALSRIYLGLHYVSDVIAAMAEGVAWLMLCHMAVTTLWHRRGLSFE